MAFELMDGGDVGSEVVCRSSDGSAAVVEVGWRYGDMSQMKGV